MTSAVCRANGQLSEPRVLRSAQGELDSFLIEISALILAKKDEDGSSYIVDKILDKTGMKGTGSPTGCPAALSAARSCLICHI